MTVVHSPGLAGSAAASRKFTWSSLVTIHNFPCAASTEYSRPSFRGAISTGSASGSDAGTNRTSVVVLSPVAMKIRLRSWESSTPTENPRHQLVTHDDGRRLAKRDKAPTLATLRD